MASACTQPVDELPVAASVLPVICTSSVPQIATVFTSVGTVMELMTVETIVMSLQRAVSSFRHVLSV